MKSVPMVPHSRFQAIMFAPVISLFAIIGVAMATPPQKRRSSPNFVNMNCFSFSELVSAQRRGSVVVSDFKMVRYQFLKRFLSKGERGHLLLRAVGKAAKTSGPCASPKCEDM